MLYYLQVLHDVLTRKDLPRDIWQCGMCTTTDKNTAKANKILMGKPDCAPIPTIDTFISIIDTKTKIWTKLDGNAPHSIKCRTFCVKSSCLRAQAHFKITAARNQIRVSHRKKSINKCIETFFVKGDATQSRRSTDALKWTYGYRRSRKSKKGNCHCHITRLVTKSGASVDDETQQQKQ